VQLGWEVGNTSWSTFEFALAHLVLGHGSHNHAFIISTSCNNCDGDISLQTCRSYHDYCK
jgi:hypothetical protein